MVINFKQPKLIDDKMAPQFTRIEKVERIGAFYDLHCVNETKNPPTRAVIRVLPKVYHTLLDHIESAVSGKGANVTELKRAATKDGEPAL
jgi:hypothetical protein